MRLAQSHMLFASSPAAAAADDFSPAFQGREKRSAISARHGSDA